MTCLNLKFDDSSLEKPVELLKKKLNIEVSDSGFTVEICKSDRLNIHSDGNSGRISYVTRASFFRMLTLFVKNYKENSIFDYSESIEFKTCGVLLDFSRNGIMKKEALAEYFSYMAMMGLNAAIVYIEAGYKLDGYPYFGYMQGAYSKEELCYIDNMGDMFGIEVYPGIQTLTHMEDYLRFTEAAPVRDTIRCLMVGADETYKLIEAMLSHLSQCFRSNKIWLGMDEGWNVGRGDYYTQNRNNNPKLPKELVIEHTKKVAELALKYNYDASICPTTLRYHDALEEMSGFEPFQKISIAEWLYEGEGTEEVFKNILNRSNPLKNRRFFLGGIQTWYGFAPENNFSLGNAKTFLPYCKKYGIDEVYGGIWMNDGTECDFFLSLLGAQAYAEYMYNAEVSDEQIKDMFEFITDTNYSAFKEMSYFHNKNMKDNGLTENDGMNFWGKKLLWSDPMMGLFDYHLYNSPMSEHYANMKNRFAEYKLGGNAFFAQRYEFLEALFDVLSLKCYIAENLKPEYLKENKNFISKAAYELFPELAEKVEILRKYHMQLWHDVCKPFGYEVLDCRYGGLISRCSSSAYRLAEYLEGRIERIEELEEERLPKALIYGGMYFGQSSACNPTSGCI